MYFLNRSICRLSGKTAFSGFISSQSITLGGCRGTTDDVATIPFHPSMSSAVLWESPNSIPVHSVMLSPYLFFCRTRLLAPHCRIVFAMPEDLQMWPYHLSFRFFTMVRRSSCTPVTFWILLRSSSFVTWSLQSPFAFHLKDLNPSLDFCCQEMIVLEILHFFSPLTFILTNLALFSLRNESDNPDATCELSP